MAKITIRLPELLHRKVHEAANDEDVSINQWVIAALMESLAKKNRDYLAERAARGDREKFHKVLAKVPDVEPAEEDRL